MTLVHAGDDIRAIKPMGLRQIGFRVLGRMVRMGMVEADDIQALIAGQLLRSDRLLWINAVLSKRLGVRVVGGECRNYGSGVAGCMAEQDATALVRIAKLRLPSNEVVARLVHPQHVQSLYTGF